MKDFFIDKLAYDLEVNKRFLDVMFSHENKMNDYILKSFSHIVNAHHIWNSRILKQESDFGVWEVHVANSLTILIEKLNEQSIQLIEKYELSDIVVYVNSEGEKFMNSMEDIIYHILNHSNYHRAQIAVEMRSLGITPPESNFIVYKR